MKLPDEITIGRFETIAVDKAKISETRTVVMFGDGSWKGLTDEPNSQCQASTYCHVNGGLCVM